MERSETIKNISKSLLDFQKKVSPILRDQEVSMKTAKGGIMAYKFADLASIQNEIIPILNECGLIVIQSPTSEYMLETTIIHAESEEFISACYKMVPAGNNPQSQGSTITYQKRYALIAMLNLQIKDDDDAKKGSERTSNEQLARKAFLKSAKDLEADSKNPTFYPRLYQAERASYEAKGSFSLREMLSEHYNHTPAIMATIEDEYFIYKTNNNLP